MTTLEELAAEVATLRGEVTELHREVAEARALASGADRDVADYRAEMRAQTRLIEALRESQVEQGVRLMEHGERLGHIEVALDQQSGDVSAIRGTLRHHGEMMREIADSLTELLRREADES